MKVKLRTAAYAAFGLAAVIVVAALVVNQLPGSSPGAQAGVDSSTGAASAAPPAGQLATPKAPAAGGKSAKRAPDSSSGGQEQQPSVNIASPYSLPPSTPRKSLVVAPLPKTASARGKVVAGFPSAVIPLAQGSTVTFSSVASAKTRLQVGLDATSSLDANAVLNFYRTALGSVGLTATATPAVGGSVALAFVRGADTVTVTASPTGGGSQYTVYGVFTTEA